MQGWQPLMSSYNGPYTFLLDWNHTVVKQHQIGIVSFQQKVLYHLYCSLNLSISLRVMWTAGFLGKSVVHRKSANMLDANCTPISNWTTSGIFVRQICSCVVQPQSLKRLMTIGGPAQCCERSDLPPVATADHTSRTSPFQLSATGKKKTA